MGIVVITGADNTTGLGTARALAGSGSEIIGLYQQDSPACRSKYWNTLIRVDQSENIVASLAGIGESLDEKAALFITQDNVVKQVSDNRNELGKYFDFRLPAQEIVDIFIDKASFHLWASQNNFNVPRSYICQSTEELADLLNDIEFPVVVKPYEKTAMWHYYSPRDKAFKLNQRRDVENMSFDIFEASPKIIVQQWIEGGDRNVYFCLVCYDRNSRCIDAVTGRKLLQWPVLCGSTAVAVSDDNDSVRKMTTEIFDSVGYQGLGSMEFKFNEIDGKYYVIEPTVGRNDLQSPLSVACGVNLTAIALAEAKGEMYDKGIYRQATWFGEMGTYAALRHNYAHNSLVVRDVFSLFSSNMIFEYFSLDDRPPGIAMYKKTFGNKILKYKKRAVGTFEKFTRRAQYAFSLLREQKYQELFYELTRKIPSNKIGYTNFYFIKCEKLNVGHFRRELNSEYQILSQKFTPQLLNRIEKELPQDLYTVRYRTAGREEKTNVIYIEHDGKIVADMFLLLDTCVPSPSTLNLEFPDKKVVTCFGVYVHEKYRLKGLHVQLLKKAYEFSSTHSDSCLYGEVHFLNKNSILSHYKAGFKVYKNVHLFKFFGKKWFIDGRNEFWCIR